MACTNVYWIVGIVVICSLVDGPRRASFFALIDGTGSGGKAVAGRITARCKSVTLVW